jgi:16S rRNA (uracil1498-N3)-methyltransferase
VNLFYQPLLPEGIHHLDEDESRHCVKVLRKRNGDELRITDGSGNFYQAIIEDASPSRCKFTVSSITPETPRNYFIHIAIAPTKNADRIEWFVEKCTEFGVDKISLVETDHTERVFLKKDRLVKVAISAMKQSLKARMPQITELRPLSAILTTSTEEHKFIAYVDEQNPDHLLRLAPPSSTYLVLIGPEGDFSTEELALAVQQKFRKVSLGNSRLRTETAGIAACHILNLING